MLNVTENIVKELGGIGEYIGAHARGGDNNFKAYARERFTELVADINEKFPQVSSYLTSLKGKCPYNFSKFEDNIIKVLYVSSDLHKEDEHMKIFLDKFPCLKMLSDFMDHLEPYKTLINPVDNKVMYHYLIPLTDLMVTARGKRVFTIHGSTFSHYMRRYNRILLGRY